MKVGCTLPQSGALASPENLIRVARRAEELGYDSVWVFERLLWPKPAQQPRPPIYLAGFGQYTFDRIAKFADGWNPAAIRDFESFEAQVNQLQETAARAGRPPMDVVLTAFPLVMETSLGHVRRPLTGTLDKLREDIKRLGRIGVTHIIFSIPEMTFAPSQTIAPALARLGQLIEIAR
ncbi:MAG: LLM class flavin-dependent oxidoreductase [Blastocatellia bacterium]